MSKRIWKNVRAYSFGSYVFQKSFHGKPTFYAAGVKRQISVLNIGFSQDKILSFLPSIQKMSVFAELHVPTKNVVTYAPIFFYNFSIFKNVFFRYREHMHTTAELNFRYIICYVGLYTITVGVQRHNAISDDVFQIWKTNQYGLKQHVV